MRRSARSWRSCTGKRIKRFTGQPTALQGTARMPRMPSKTCKTDPGPPSSDFKKDPEGYLCRAGINDARSIGRRQERQKLADVDVNDLDIPLTAAIWGGDGDTEHLEDLDRRLRFARHQLDPYLAALVTLHYDLKCKAKVIAKICRRTRPAIFMSLWRARRELGKLMFTPGETQ